MRKWYNRDDNTHLPESHEDWQQMSRAPGGAGERWMPMRDSHPLSWILLSSITERSLPRVSAYSVPSICPCSGVVFGPSIPALAFLWVLVFLNFLHPRCRVGSFLDCGYCPGPFQFHFLPSWYVQRVSRSVPETLASVQVNSFLWAHSWIASFSFFI